MNVTRHRFEAVGAAVSKACSGWGWTGKSRPASRFTLSIATAAVLALPACSTTSEVNEPVADVSMNSVDTVNTNRIEIYTPATNGPLSPTIEGPLAGIPADLRLTSSQIENLAAATSRVVVTDTPRTAENWRDFESVSGRVEAGPAFMAGLQDMHGDALRVPVTLASSFLIVPTQERGRTRVNANYRNGPGTDYTKLGILPRGTEVAILGQVGASDWVLITRGSQGTDGIGYMFRPLIVTSQVAPLSSDALLGQGMAFDLAGDPSLSGNYNESQLEQILTGGTARRPLVCRDLRHTVTSDQGRQYSWTSTACRLRPLRWRIVPTPLDSEV